MIIDRNVARVARTMAYAIEGSGAAVVQTVLVAVLAYAVVVRIFGERTFRHAVWTVLYVLTANA